MNSDVARRVRIFTNEMRQSANFAMASHKIEHAIATGRERDAKKYIRALMQQLLRKPSGQTVEYLLELHRRWGCLIDILKYLEAHLEPWATWEDYFDIIWHKCALEPLNTEFIQLIHSLMENIPAGDDSLAKEHLRGVIEIIIGFDHDHSLVAELVRILDTKFGYLLNVNAFVGELYALRALSSRPRSPEERVSFLRACGLDPSRIAKD